VLLSLVYGSVTDEFPDSTYPIAKPNSAWICCIQLKLWPFLWYFAYFGQNLVAVATSLRLLQSEVSSLDWSTTKTPHGVHNVITGNKFHQNRLRGFPATGVQKSGSPIDLACRPYNSSALPCWLWCVMHDLFMVALYNRADHYIFALWFLSFFFFSSPNLSGRRLDANHTSPHGVDLV